MSRFEAVFHDGSFQVSGALNRMMSQPPAVHQFLYGVPELAPKMILGQDPRDLIYGEDEEQDRALFTDARVLDELARTRDRKLTGRLHVPGDVLASYRRRTATLPAAAAAAAGSAASLPAASQHLTTSTSLREYGDREEPPAELLHSTVSTLQPTRPVGRSGRPASLVTFTNRTPSGSTYDITPYT